MNKIFKNVTANIIGTIGNALLMFFAFPIYLKLLGSERFGLVSFFFSLQMLLSSLDLGVSKIINREIASNKNKTNNFELFSTIRSVEILNYLTSIFIIFIFFIISDYLAADWFRYNNLEKSEVKISVVLLSLVIAIRWPITFYNAIYRGYEEHMSLNILLILFGLLRILGTILVLKIYLYSLFAYGIYQAIISLVEIIYIRIKIFRKIGLHKLSYLDITVNRVYKILKISSGIAVASIVAVIIKQLDKLILSKFVTLDEIGYYYSATFIMTGIGLIAGAITNSYYPIFSRLIAVDQFELEKKFHESSLLISCLVAPLCALLSLNSFEFLYLWTNNQVLAEKGQWILIILAIATTINACMQAELNIQYAAGLTWMSAINNLLGLILLVPTIYLLVINFGIIGGAIAWLIYNLLSYLIFPRFVHKKILINALHKWYFYDTLSLIIISYVSFAVLKFILVYVAGVSNGLLMISLMFVFLLLQYIFYYFKYLSLFYKKK